MIRTLFAAVLLLCPLAVSRADHDHNAMMMACAKACDDCARTCDACATHCGKMLMEGKKEHVTTHRTCSDCATICRAAGSIVAREGPFHGIICTACADACKQCGDACEKVGADPMMKQCAEECRKCEKACRDMMKLMNGK